MSGHAPPHGHDEHDDDGFEGEKPKINWLIVIAIVAALLLLGIFPVMSMFNHSSPDVTTVPSAAQIAPSATVQIGPVACPAFTRERQTCTFDEHGTQNIGYGETGEGLYYCYDTPFGTSSAFLYRREYHDTGVWLEWGMTNVSGTVRTQRLVGNLQGQPVTVTYWLSETSCAPGHAPAIEESVQQPDDAGDSDDEYIPIH